jgi:hypothetical protein
MSKVATFTAGLIRRVKNMGDFWLTISIFFLTLGFLVRTMSTNPKLETAGVIGIIGGIGFLVYAYILTVREKRKEQKLFEDMLKELKKLNQSKDTSEND